MTETPAELEARLRKELAKELREEFTDQITRHTEALHEMYGQQMQDGVSAEVIANMQQDHDDKVQQLRDEQAKRLDELQDELKRSLARNDAHPHCDNNASEEKKNKAEHPRPAAAPLLTVLIQRTRRFSLLRSSGRAASRLLDPGVARFSHPRSSGRAASHFLDPAATPLLAS